MNSCIQYAIKMALDKGCNSLEMSTVAPGEWRLTLKYNNRSVKRSLKLSHEYVSGVILPRVQEV